MMELEIVIEKLKESNVATNALWIKKQIYYINIILI